MKKNRSTLFVIVLIVMALLVAACGGEKPSTTEVTPVATDGTFTVPSYATNFSVLEVAANNIEGRQKFFRDLASDDLVVESGVLGVLVDRDALTYIFDGSNVAESYGQRCVFYYEDEDWVDYNLDAKTLTFHIRTTTLNLDFLQWCQSQISLSIDAYVVTALAEEGGFTINFTFEEWRVKAIFRLNN